MTLLGQRNDVPDLLRAFDVAVCCSDFEGTPLSILEYMEAALPVVATGVGGMPDLIDSGRAGAARGTARPGGARRGRGEVCSTTGSWPRRWAPARAATAASRVRHRRHRERRSSGSTPGLAEDAPLSSTLRSGRAGSDRTHRSGARRVEALLVSHREQRRPHRQHQPDELVRLGADEEARGRIADQRDEQAAGGIPSVSRRCG